MYTGAKRRCSRVQASQINNSIASPSPAADSSQSLPIQRTSGSSPQHTTNMEVKLCWWPLALLALVVVSVVSAEGEVWEESEHEVLIRSERGAKNRETCRYAKGAWTDCDSKTNARSRTLTLKKGDPATCERIKTIQKKCKKACRYEKSSWSDCSASGEMTRTDMLKPNSDPTCEHSRRLTKKCNKNKQVKTAKGRRNRQ